MQFVVGGKLFNLSDTHPTADQRFRELHSAYFGNGTFNWDDMYVAAVTFFGQPGITSTQHDSFFGNFTIIWNYLKDAGRLDDAETIWRMALAPAIDWERRNQNQGQFVHKGVPYYFWGMTALLKGDLDRGYAMMHQAVEEDNRTHGSLSDTPAFALATLNYEKTDQAFRPWVLMQAQFIDERLSKYRATYGKTLTLQKLKDTFLKQPPNTDTIFQFVYAVARLLRLNQIPDYALASGFAGQLEINLLFDLVLVIDAAISFKNPNQWKFIQHAAFLSKHANLSLPQNKLKELNGMFNRDFDTTLRDVLDHTLQFKDTSIPTGLEADVGIAYGLRNRRAHDVSSVPTIWQRFPILSRACSMPFF